MRSLKNIIFLSTIFIVTVAFNFQHNPPSNWYQQFLPDVEGQSIKDMTFTDSLNGYIVTSFKILKTTNGGDNWIINYNSGSTILNRVQFINANTGFVAGEDFFKTTNAGANWFVVKSGIFSNDAWILNEDTAWYASSESLTGGVYRTTNGGMNWTQQYSAGNQNPDKIYFYNARIGFIASNGGVRYVSKTTNGGINWTQILSNDFIRDIYFSDSLTGWKSSAFGMKKTTNGGLNWVTQFIPPTHNTGILRFSNVNKDTIWGVGGTVLFPGNRQRGILYRTTNGGDNWAYQVPDTSIVLGYELIDFVNHKNGWAYAPYERSGIHTRYGGDTTFLTKIFTENTTTPKEFYLFQNYPNPFNPTTFISYELKSSDFISLKVFDLNGKEIQTLINKKQSAGSYTIEFNASNLSSGIYFYSLQTESYTETKKMILIK